MTKLRVLLFVLISVVTFSFAFSQENCNNGIDDNGNGLIDCNDPECQYAASIERGCNCDDGVDNDGDGLIDIYDGECASFYGMTFVGEEDSDCSIMPPDSLNIFDFMDVAGSSQQNTVDTQSKMAIGDLDGDGIPEIVATSKWGSAVRVIASGGDPVYDAGELLDEFGSTGQDDIFPKGNYVYELEVVIADIDGDGQAEIFSYAGNRKNPFSEPDRFYLVALTYRNGQLEPLYDAVYMGDARPGIMGIADFDGDGLAEIYYKNQIHSAETGVLLAQGTGDWETEVNSAPVAVNILPSTPNLELIVGGIIYAVPDLTNRNPATPLTLTVAADINDLGAQFYPKVLFDAVEYGETNYSSTSVADMNGDGHLDIVLSGARGSSSGNTAIYFWDVFNNTYSYYEPVDLVYPGGWPWGTSRPNLGDADGDGNMDILFIAGNQLFALTLDAGGNLVPLWPTPRIINDSRSGIVAVTIYDFDNDGNPEVVYRDSQQLVIVDGATGQNVLFSAKCQSHTMTEGPIIADVDGDGGTDICVPCNFNSSFDINDDIQQQALGAINIFFSTENLWLPTRKVWNQPGYFVVNINDDLTVPRQQMDQGMIFGQDPCSNGIPGPVRPFNIFLNQAPTIASDGCPFYPAPDVSFVGDNPNALPGDPDYKDPNDPTYFPAVNVIPPICGNLGIEVEFNIINDGSLTISDAIPVSFWDGDPTIDPVPAQPATLLYQEDLIVNNFRVGDTISINGVVFNSTGKAFRLFIVLNDDGTALPAGQGSGSLTECKLDNNVYYFDIIPDPFEVDIAKIQDNIKCEDSAPDNGELRAVVTRNGVEVLDYSDFAFQWYDDATATTAIPAPGGTANVLTGLPEGDYSLIVTNTDKGCASIPTDTSIVRIGVDPEITIIENSPQSHCIPPNGELEVFITGGNAGFTFEWFDRFFNPIGITGSVASNLVAGEYIVSVFKDGCTKTGSYTLNGPTFPVVQTSLINDVINCANLNSGKITAEAVIGGLVQDSANYTFMWYEWDSVANDIGTILPPIHGTGPTRSGLLAGEYAVVVRDDITGCESDPPIRQLIQDLTVFPTITMAELTPQTSCDPANPNGQIMAEGYINGVLQNATNLTFEWFEGDNTLPANLITDVEGVNGEIANGIAGGLPYTVRITTIDNCFTTLYDTISDASQLPVVAAIPFDNNICGPSLALGGIYTGRAEASATFDGIAVSDYSDYTYTWFDGEDINNDPVLTSTSAEGDILYELDAGRYTVILERNSLNCISVPVTVEVFDATTLPIINVSEVPATNCVDGTPNGELLASVDIGGVPTFTGHTFQWFEGVDVTASGTPVSVTGGVNSELALQLSANNTYTVLVTNDTTGCQNTLSFIVSDSSELPLISLLQTPNSICDPAVAGVAYNGTVSGTTTYQGAGVADYTNYYFNLYEGSDTLGVLNNTVTAAAGNFTALDSGFYTMRAYNTLLGCYSDPVTIEVLDNFVLPVISLTEQGATNCDPLLPNGVLTADAGGILTDHTFHWVSGLDVNAAQWAPVSGAVDETAESLLAGDTYSVKVTINNSGCFDTQSRVVSDSSELPLISLVQTPNSICDPVVSGVNYNGTISGVTTYRGAGVTDYTDYYFDLYEGTGIVGPAYGTVTASAANFIELDSGFYTMQAVNTALGCYSDPVTIEVLENFVLPVITLTEQGATNCDPLLPNGVLTADAGGILTDHTFHWVSGLDVNAAQWAPVSGAVDETAESLLAGDTYSVKVTINNSGCFDTQSRVVSDSSELPLISLVQTPNSICDPAVAGVAYNGTVSGTTTYQGAGVADYTNYYFNLYEGNDTTGVLNNTVTAAAGNFTALDSGFYTMRAYNTLLGCYSDPVTIEVLENFVLPVISLTEQGATNCDPLLPNGVLTADAGGILTDHTFHWVSGLDVNAAQWAPVSGAVDETAESLLAGDTYSVKVTINNSGCFDTQSRVVSDSSELPLISLVQTPNSICDPAVAGVAYNGTVSGATTYQGAGVADYTNYYFNLYEGSDTLGVLNNTVTAAAGNFTALDSGFYTMRAYNTLLGCYSDPVTIEVLENFVLPVISLTEQGATNCDPLLPNGVLTADAGGILTDHTFHWVSGLDVNAAQWTPVSGAVDETAESLLAGDTYSVKVTINTSGCFDTQSRVVSDSSELPLISLVQTPNSICDPAVAGVAYNGTVSGTTTYQGAGVADYTNYYFNLYEGSDTLGVLNNTVTAAAGNFTALDSGFYTMRAYNTLLGCYSDPVTIEVLENFVLPVISLTEQGATNCDPLLPNGVLTADAGGILTDHTFHWVNGLDVNAAQWTPVSGAVDETAESLLAGDTYSVKVTINNSGCFDTQSRVVSDSSEVPVLSLVQTPNTICDDAIAGAFDGTITGSLDYHGIVIADFTPFDFNLFEGSDTTGVILQPISGLSPDFIELEDGDYTVRAYEFSSGCFSDPVSIAVQDNTVLPNILITEEPNSSCDDAQPNGNIQAFVDVIGNTVDHTFIWYDGATVTPGNETATTGGVGEIITLMGNQNYTVEVVNQISGCPNSLSTFLNRIIPTYDLSINVTDIVDCNTPGQIVATVDSSGTGPVADYTNYEFYWYRGDVVNTGSELPTITRTLTEVSPGQVLYSEDYTVNAVNTYTHCVTNDITGFVAAPAPLFIIDHELTFIPSDCNQFEGAITASIGGNVTNYNFYWYDGRNINPGSNFYTDPSVEFAGDSLLINLPDASLNYSGTYYAPRNIQEGPTIYALQDGIYSVIVEDHNSGCKEYIEINLPSVATPPAIVGNVTGSSICPITIGNGTASAAIHPDSLTAYGYNNDQYNFYLYDGISTNPAELISSAEPGDTGVGNFTLLSNTLAPGFYTLQAIEQITPSNCPSVPLTVEIRALALPPVVELNSAILNNTSCDSTVVNGQIELLVLKDPADSTAASTYELIWGSTATTSPPDVSGVVAGVQGPYGGLNLGTYDVIVTDEVTNCFSTESYEIYNTPPEISVDETTLIVTDKFYCVPSGHIEIADIMVGGVSEPLADFNYEWFDGPADLASNTAIGPPADTERLDSTNYATIHDGTYYVIATKDPASGGDGLGCESAPFNRQIIDRTVDPTILFSTQANLACDSSFATGALTIDINTGGSLASDYEFTISSTALAGPISDFTGADGSYSEINLGPGVYEVSARDVDNECVTISSRTIDDHPVIPHIEAADLTIIDQLICANDGSIIVNAIRVDATIEIPGSNPGEVNYEFTWYEDQPLPPNLGINSNTIDTTNFPLMEAGIFYFTALRNNDAHEPGEGCETPPYMVEVDDISVDPTINLVASANQACDLTFATGSLTMNLATGAAPASDYGYMISSATYGPVNGFTNSDGTPESWTEINLGPGQYNVSVQDVDNFCVSNGTITINDNPAVPYVESVDLTILPQAICANDGSITVNSIRINGVPETPGTNPGEVNYLFTWYEGQVAAPDLGITGNVLDTSNYAGTQAGTYYFTALRDNDANQPGEGCETAPFAAVIDDISVDPTINLVASANQACDLTFATGSLTMNLATGAAPASDYGYMISSATYGPVNGFTNSDGTPESWTEINLGPGQYNVSVQDVDNFCVSNGTITINDNPAVPYVESVDLTILPQAICANDGSITVNSIRINGVPETPGTNPGEVNYLFTWYEGQVAAPDLGITGNVLDTSNYAGTQAGTYYFTALRDNDANQPGEGCETAPFAAVIDDISVDPTINLVASANQACDLTFATGSLTMNLATGAAPASDYGYTISSATYGPVNGFTNSDGTPESWTEINLGPGQYNVSVQDVDNFCVSNGTITINDNPAVPYVESVDLTILPQAICANDGSITVNSIRINGVPETPGTNPGEVNYLFTWYEGQVAAPDLGITGNVLDTSNYAGTQAGTYYFTALRDNDANQPGEGCETAPFAAVIEDISEDPLLALSMTANQSCDTSIVASGEIRAVVTPALNSIDRFNYTWTAFPTDQPGEYVNTDSLDVTFANRSFGQYTLQLEDVFTRCMATGSITVTNNPFTPIIDNTDYLVNDQSVCFNDGSVIVFGVTPGDTSQYDFAWFEGITNLNSNTTIAGVTDGILDTTTYALIQAGDYYFTATNVDPTLPIGYGCETAPVLATINDVSVDPVIALATTANQNCDLSFANGTLLADVTTSGVPGPSYSYTLSSSVLGSPIDSLLHDAQVFYDSLRPGSYNVYVVDDVTQCVSNRNITVDDSPVFIEVTDINYTVTDQVYCAPDGSIRIDDITENGLLQNLSEYTYVWYQGESNLNGNNPVAGVTDSFLDTTNFATIGAGDHYFTVTKLASAARPGVGCESAPLRADIFDIHTDPNVTFNLITNTSCDPTNPNGIVIATSFENDGTDTDIYSYVWTYNGGALPAGVIQNDSLNTSQLSVAPEGQYQLLVTNSSRTQCFVNGGTTLDIDQYSEVPNIIIVNVTDPLFCYPTGELEVTQITVGGRPANVADFEYEWYQSNFTPGDLILDSLGNPVVNPLLSNIYPDLYYVIARDSITRCESIPKEAIVSDASIVYPAIHITQSAPQSSCDPMQPNASLVATADGGNDDTNPDYQFTWFNSLDGSGPSIDTTSTINGLGADNYSVNVFNVVTGCNSLDYYITEDDILNSMPIVSVAASPKTNCIIDDGLVSAQVTNYTGNFQFDWYIGDVTGTVPDYTGQFITGLAPGLYTVTATELDTTFCTSDAVVVEVRDERMVPNVMIDEDNPLTNCWITDPNGQFSATVNGMVGGYTFEWYIGMDTTGIPDHNEATYSGLSPQSYTLVVTDDITNCSEVQSVDLTDNTVTPPVADPEVVQHLLSCIDLDGWVRASVGGNTIDYTFDWSDGSSVNNPSDWTGINYRNLDAGIYTVTAQDMITGCISDGRQVEVLDQREMPMFTFNVVPAHCENSDGSVEIVWENDVAIGNTTWYDSETGQHIETGSAIYEYPPGWYEVVVTSAYGCEEIQEVEIGTEIFEFNGISANGDGRNDYFDIACISMFPDNHVRIYNRAGQLVYEEFGYNNMDKAFTGIGENGMYLAGRELPDGTYFYIIDKRDGTDAIAGYLELIR